MFKQVEMGIRSYPKIFIAALFVLIGIGGFLYSVIELHNFVIGGGFLVVFPIIGGLLLGIDRQRNNENHEKREDSNDNAE